MESEIWYTLHSIANSMSELKAAGVYHGDIQPCNILIDEAGNVKLLDVMCYDNNNNTGVLRMIQSSTHASPLAPELFDQFIKRVPQSNYNQEKADIYSLGITLLCICSINDYRTSFYSFQECKIKQDVVTQEVSKISQSGRYSQALLQALAGMLQPDPNKRFSLDQLQKFIGDHVEM